VLPWKKHNRIQASPIQQIIKYDQKIISTSTSQTHPSQYYNIKILLKNQNHLTKNKYKTQTDTKQDQL
jgi:hypothetical protein